MKISRKELAERLDGTGVTIDQNDSPYDAFRKIAEANIPRVAARWERMKIEGWYYDPVIVKHDHASMLFCCTIPLTGVCSPMEWCE